MKNIIKLVFLFVTIVMVWSCNETSKKDKEVIKKNETKTVKAKKKNAQAKLLEQLKETTPVNTDDLEAWMPKTLGGLSLERTKSTSIFGEAQMFGWYKRVEDKMITLSITDAAGPNGSIAADKINILGTEPESDVGDIQMRSVKVKGRMARQDYHTKGNMTILIFFHKNRFMIMLTAHDHNVEETWELVDELDFDALDKLMN